MDVLFTFSKHYSVDWSLQKSPEELIGKESNPRAMLPCCDRARLPVQPNSEEKCQCCSAFELKLGSRRALK